MLKHRVVGLMAMVMVSSMVPAFGMSNVNWQDHLRVAKIYESKGLTMFASDEYEAAIKCAATTTIPTADYVRYLIELRRFEEAEKLLVQAEHRWIKESKFYRLHSKLLLSQLRLAEAQRVAAEGARKHQADDQLWMIDVLSAVAQNKIELADRETKAAQHALPGNKRIEILPIVVRFAEKKFEEVAKDAASSKTLDPDSPMNAFAIAALERTGKKSAAAQRYLEWFRVRQYDPAFAAGLCVYLVKCDRQAAAIEPALVALCHRMKEKHLNIAEALSNTTEGRVLCRLLSETKPCEQQASMKAAQGYFAAVADKQLVRTAYLAALTKQNQRNG